MKRQIPTLAAHKTFPSRVFTGAALLVAGLVLAPPPATRAAEPVALDALVGEIVARNPEMRFYEAEIAAARGGRLTAGAWANPELSGELGHKQVHDLSGNDLGNGPIWAVSLSQTFEFPGRLGLRKAIANRQIAMAASLDRRFNVKALASMMRVSSRGATPAASRCTRVASKSWKRFATSPDASARCCAASSW